MSSALKWLFNGVLAIKFFGADGNDRFVGSFMK
jgi:hypothetical protein